MLRKELEMSVFGKRVLTPSNVFLRHKIKGLLQCAENATVQTSQRRCMHFKQAIRPAILPTGLPAKTADWKIIRQQMKIQFLTDDNIFIAPSDMIRGKELSPMKAHFTEVDYKVIRKNRKLLYHHRLVLLAQRVSYLKTVKVTKREKYLNIKSKPPPLILSLDADGNTGYLHGLIADETNFIFILYPLFFQIKYSRLMQERRCDFISEELGVEREKVLKLAFDTPCFMLNRSYSETLGRRFLFTHKFLLPPTYSLDKHTAEIYPPIFNAKGVGKVYQNATESGVESSFEFNLDNVLDTEYPICNGRGTLEDLSNFLLESRKDESYQLREKRASRRVVHYF